MSQQKPSGKKKKTWRVRGFNHHSRHQIFNLAERKGIPANQVIIQLLADFITDCPSELKTKPLPCGNDELAIYSCPPDIRDNINFIANNLNIHPRQFLKIIIPFQLTKIADHMKTPLPS